MKIKRATRKLRVLSIFPHSPATFYGVTFLRHLSLRTAFTLLELLVVVGIIGLLLAFLIPSLGPASGRVLEGSTRQFVADLEGARLIAMAERTKARVLIAATNDANWGQNLAWRTYMVASFNSVAGTWTQRGKLNRLATSAAFDPATGIIATRKTSITSVAKVAGGTPTNFTGAYVEFRPNGGTSLDPSAAAEIIRLEDAVADASPTPIPKNQNLGFQITIDPLTGSAQLQ